MSARTRGITHTKRKKKAATPEPERGIITLANPVAEHFATFIIGNAELRESVALEMLRQVAPEALADLNARAATMEAPEVDAAFRALCGQHGTHGVCQEGSAAGQHIVLCGAGPSLAEHIAEHAPTADQIWGCNSALTWLADHGYAPTHGFCIDQQTAMIGEWGSTPDVEYLLATSVHPNLTEFLLGRGCRIRFFHNYVGIPGAPVTTEDGRVLPFEDWMYSGLFPSTIRVGSGLNAVSRALDLALYAGAAKVTVLGADCAIRVKSPMPDVALGSPEHLRWLREETVMHADGGHALASGATPVTFGGEIDGRHWTTKPDLVITAQTLRKMADAMPERVVLVGDTLPNALAGKSDAFLARLPQLRSGREVEMAGS